MTTIYAIFSDKYMPQFSDFWAAFSTLENAVVAVTKLPSEIIREHRLEIYEIPVDAKNHEGKKRLDANDPRLIAIAKQMASRRSDGS